MLLIFVITGLLLAVAIYAASEFIEEHKIEKVLWRDHHANTEKGLVNLGTFFDQQWVERDKVCFHLHKVNQGGKQFELARSGGAYRREEDGSLKRIDRAKSSKKQKKADKDFNHKKRFAEKQADMDFKDGKTVDENPFKHDDFRRTIWTQTFVQLKRAAS